MAAKKFSPFPILKREKLPIHNALCEMSHNFQSICDCLQGLDDPAFPKGMLRLFHAQAEALRAGIAHLLTGALHRRESVDWYHFGKQADRLERKQKQAATISKR